MDEPAVDVIEAGFEQFEGTKIIWPAKYANEREIPEAHSS